MTHTDPYRITLSARTVKIMVILLSVLSGLAMVAGAGQASEVIDPKVLGFSVIVIGAIQQVINGLLARAVGQQVEASAEVAERAGAAAARASNVARQVAGQVADTGPHPATGKAHVPPPL